jgi:hypothetical protein
MPVDAMADLIDEHDTRLGLPKAYDHADILLADSEASDIRAIWAAEVTRLDYLQAGQPLQSRRKDRRLCGT